MMPLMVADRAKFFEVAKVGGDDKTRAHLENLGFGPGAKVQVISELGGNLIVNVKDTRIALDKSLAMKILV